MKRKITNSTKKVQVASGYRLCSSVVSKAWGLMFRFSVKDPLIFAFTRQRRYSLHMFFVFFPIDVLFLDKNRKVVDMKRDFMPFTFYTPKKPCQYIIEIAQGSIARSQTEIGDEISF